MANDESTALIPLDERQVDFYGDQVVAVLVEVDEKQQVYVPMRPICEYLGLAWNGQLARIKRDPVMAGALRGVHIMRTPGAGGGSQEMACLPLKYLPGFLFGVTVGKVRPELRDRLTLYRQECFEVLWQAFQSHVPAQTKDSSLVVLESIRQQSLAMAELAAQQIAYQLQTNTRLDRAAEAVADLRQRMSIVEQRTIAGPITDEQAAIVQNQVRSLAELMTERDPSRNHYAEIFNSLYRHFGVSSYKLIKPRQYQAVLDFLEDWRRRIAGQQDG